CGAADDDDEGHTTDRLSQDGRQRRGTDAETENRYQDDVTDDVEGRGDQRYDHRRRGQLFAPQVPGSGEGYEQERQAEHADAQVYVRRFCGGLLSPEQPDQRLHTDPDHQTEDDADTDGEPQALDCVVGRTAFVTGAQEPGDGGGGAVSEEDAKRGEGEQDRRGHGETAQRVGAQMADDRG